MAILNVRKIIRLFGVTAFLLILLFLVDLPYRKKSPPVITDIQQIKKRGVLIATTENNSAAYFIYRGHPMGFQLEMLQRFAKYIGVKLELLVSNDNDHALSKLVTGKCDLIAMDVSGNRNFYDYISLSVPYAYSRQVLVQKKPDNWRSMKKDSLEKHLVRNPSQLIGKTIFVPVESSYYSSLKHLVMVKNAPVFFSRVEGMDYWELASLVESGQIDFTICDEETAYLNSPFFRDLDFKTVVSPPHPLTWAVRTEASGLLRVLNKWLGRFTKTKEYKDLYARYFVNSGYYTKMMKVETSSVKKGKISPYDNEMKKLSVDLGWDWRLLASLVFQESKFDTGLVGVGGSSGIMQLMPVTAKKYGGGRNAGPLSNLRAGVKYLKWLDKHYSDGIPDANERVYFILAAYNIGHGHVDDARALTAKYKHNPNLWHGNVEEFLKLKSKPQYYRDPVVKSGYCRCMTVTRFVEDVLQRYKHYANVVKK